MKEKINFLLVPFKNGYAMSGDNDEVTMAGKGMRWGVAAVIIVLVVIGIVLGNTVFKQSIANVKTQINKMTSIFTDIDSTETSINPN